ncbi:MAG: nth [Clostridiales bacterium]|nr:nth [Clostridiales bacterium]
MKNDKNINGILNALSEAYPDTRSELNYETPFQLLIATIMSAQASDKKVNEITAVLFRKYKTPEDFIKLDLEELEKEIRQINYYKTKARHILGVCKELIEKYNGEVPIDREELVKLPGVGRKTANVVLSYAFGIPAIAVDTHVHRVANRIGMVCTKKPEQTELELEKEVPREFWSKAHSSLVLHGRRVCDAKKPKCDICTLTVYCKQFKKEQ